MDELRSENNAARDWTELAVKHVNDTINEAAEIWFKPEKKCGAYCFGSVTVKTFAGKSVNLSMHLIEKDLANSSNNFERGKYQFNLSPSFPLSAITKRMSFFLNRFDANCNFGEITLAKEQRRHG